MKFTIVKKSIKPQLNQKSVARRTESGAKTALARLIAAPGSRNDLLPEQKLKLLDLSSLKRPKSRLRKADVSHVANIAKSIKIVGQGAPVIIDAEGQIINGDAVVQALKELGETQVWCVVLDHLSEDEADFLRIALNKLSDGSDWLMEDLRPALIKLEEIGFDLIGTGFTLPELDIIMLPDALESAPEAEEQVPEPECVVISELGDLWLLGEHRLLCGDSTSPESYRLVLSGTLADAIFTDCPWNIPIDGFVSGLGKVKHQDFKMAAGEMSEEQFLAFVDAFTALCTEHLADGGVFFSCIDWRSVDKIIAAAKEAGLNKDLLCWSRCRDRRGRVCFGER